MERPPAAASKSAWRSWARSERKGLEISRLSEQVVERLAVWGPLAAARQVLLFSALPGEIELAPLVERLPEATFLLTRTPPEGGLTIHPLLEGMERHSLGFLQPPEGSPEVPPSSVDVALVPGLVFDRRGVRMGHGGGHFDRLLGRMRQDCPRVGVIPSALVVARLPEDSHDVRMTHLATEHGVEPVVRS